MTTLERAARACAFHRCVDGDWSPWDSLDDVAKAKYRSQASAVLMAVLPELQRWDIMDEEGSMMGWCQYPQFDGEFVKYDDLTAILAEGE